LDGVKLNVAPTAVFELTVTVQVDDVPVQPCPELVEGATDQPENVEPEVGVAVRVTIVPVVTEVEQVEPQLIGPPETVPVPVPDLVTERV
jgi:hypothetical protein